MNSALKLTTRPRVGETTEYRWILVQTIPSPLYSFVLQLSDEFIFIPAGLVLAFSIEYHVPLITFLSFVLERERVGGG